MLKELSKELLNQLKRNPQSGRQLAEAVKRNNGIVGKTLRRLEKLGYIRRAHTKWVFVADQPVLEAFKTEWSIESASEFYLNGLLSKTSLASPKDLTVVGSIRRMWDEAARYLEHHHPETVEQGERRRTFAAALFDVLRQAHAHDRVVFQDIVENVVREQFDFVAGRVRAYRATSEARIDGNRLFYTWLLLGSPDPMPNQFYFPTISKPERNDALLQHAWSIAYDDQEVSVEESEALFDMIAVLDERELLRAFEEQKEIRTLDQGPVIEDAATEPLGERS
jgi:hypothetical protein